MSTARPVLGWVSVVGVLVCSVEAWGQDSSQCYDFTLIADSRDGSGAGYGLFGFPNVSLNDDGVVAYVACGNLAIAALGGSGAGCTVYAGDGRGDPVAVLDDSGAYVTDNPIDGLPRAIHALQGAPTIGNDGAITVGVLLDDGAEGTSAIAVVSGWDEGPANVVGYVDDHPGSFGLDALGGVPRNTSGTIAAVANWRSPVPGDDRLLSATVQIDADGTVHDVLPFGAPADQNEAGTLTHYQFSYIFADDSYEGGVYRTNPDGTQELVANTTVDSSILGGTHSGSVRPSINGLGHVAFSGRLPDLQEGVFAEQCNQDVDVVAYTADFQGLPIDGIGPAQLVAPNQNDFDTTAFSYVFADNGAFLGWGGVYTGGDDIGDKVITKNDTLDGAQVLSASGDLFSNRFLNNHRQIGFVAELYNWSTNEQYVAIYRADPVGQDDPPEIEVNGDDVLLERCDAYTGDEGATAFDSCPCREAQVSIAGASTEALIIGDPPLCESRDLTCLMQTDTEVDTSECGIGTVTYSVTDEGGNFASGVREVVIDDTEAPVLTLSGPNVETIECDQDASPYVDPGYAATDGCSGDVTADVVVTASPSAVDPTTPGTWTLDYAIDDCGDNRSTDARQVIVDDTLDPIITCPDDVATTCGEEPPEVTATATDGCDPAPDVACGPAVDGVVTCTATDATGNASSCTFEFAAPTASFSGFDAPVGGADATGGSFFAPVRAFKLGSTIPFKFSLSCGGQPITTGIHTFQLTKFSDETTGDTPIDASPTDAATTGNQARFSGPGWHYNLDTQATNMSRGIWRVDLTLADGSTHFVWIQLK